MVIEYDDKKFKKLMAAFKRSINYCLKYGRDSLNGVDIQVIFLYNKEKEDLTYIIVGKQTKALFTATIPRMYYLITSDQSEFDYGFNPEDGYLMSQIITIDIYKVKPSIDALKGKTCTITIEPEAKEYFHLDIGIKIKSESDRYNELSHLWFTSNGGNEITAITTKSIHRTRTDKRDEFTNMVFSDASKVENMFTLLHHDSCGHLALKYVDDDDKTIEKDVMLFGMFIPTKPNRIEVYRTKSIGATPLDLTIDKTVVASNILWFNGFKVLIFYRYIDIFETLRTELTTTQRIQLELLEEMQQENYDKNIIPMKMNIGDVLNATDDTDSTTDTETTTIKD